MFDIITIGDMMTDIFLDLDERSSLCRVDRKKQELRIKFASKIPLSGTKRVIGGGNASNHAIGAARLGLKTAIYTIVGADDAGDAYYHKIKHAGVANEYVKCDKDQGTNLSVILNYNEEKTALSYHAERHYKLPRLPGTKWLYFSSIAGNHDEFNRELIRFVKNHPVRLAFNPGSRQMELGLKKLRPIFAVCDVLFLNRDEAGRLAGKDKPVKSLLKAFLAVGVKTVVITDGAKGSYCFDGQAFYKIGIFPAKKVETTGCGDAYGSGFLSAIVLGKKVAEAMRWGTANSASVLEHIGAQDGLLTRRGLAARLAKNINFQAKVM